MILNSSRTDWVNIPLSILCTTIVGGGTPSTKISEYWEGSIPWISSADIDNSNRINPRRYVTYEAIENSATNLVPKDTLIVVTRVGLGKLALAPFELCFSQDNQGLIFHENVVLPKYALYFLKTVVNDLTVKGRGTTISGVTKKHLQELIFALPPLPEQRRIVAKIEELFSKLDKGVETLKTLQQQLNVYRRAVLKSAFEGKLTEDWRNQWTNLPNCNQLIATIIKERDKKAAEKALKMKAFKPIADEIISGLPKIPHEWAWVRLGDITWSVKDGPHYSPDYTETGIPFISGGNVRPNGVDFSTAKHISIELHKELCKRCMPENNDILYTKGGTTGIARVNTYGSEFSVWVHVAVLKLIDVVKPFYLQHCLNSPGCYRQSQNFTHGVGNQDLGLTRMINIQLPICSLEEQVKIIDEIESRLSVADKLEETIGQSLQQAEALRQSILKKAFEGRLLSESELEEVRQEPDWEPASVLLDKIKARKSSADTSKPPAKKSTRKGKKQS